MVSKGTVVGYGWKAGMADEFTDALQELTGKLWESAPGTLGFSNEMAKRYRERGGVAGEDGTVWQSEHTGDMLDKTLGLELHNEIFREVMKEAFQQLMETYE